jgi:hypothetical protein
VEERFGRIKKQVWPFSSSKNEFVSLNSEASLAVIVKVEEEFGRHGVMAGDESWGWLSTFLGF